MGEGFFQFSLLNYIYIYFISCLSENIKRDMIDAIDCSFHGINYTNCCF